MFISSDKKEINEIETSTNELIQYILTTQRLYQR